MSSSGTLNLNDSPKKLIKGGNIGDKKRVILFSTMALIITHFGWLPTHSLWLVSLSGLLVLYFNLPMEYVGHIKLHKLILYQTELTLLLPKLVLPFEFIISFNDNITPLKFPLESLLNLWLFSWLLPPSTTSFSSLVQLGHKRYCSVTTQISWLLSISIAAPQVQAIIITQLDNLIMTLFCWKETASITC